MDVNAFKRIWTRSTWISEHFDAIHWKQTDSDGLACIQMDLHGYTLIWSRLIYGLWWPAGCGALCQPVTPKNRKLWPFCNTMLSPGLHGWLAGIMVAGRMVAGWLDGWMAGWLLGWPDGWMNGWMDDWLAGI